MTTLTKAERRLKWLAIALTALVVIAALMSTAHAQAANTVSFELTTAVSNNQITPTLTWSTSPAASSCTASGATDWTGTKAVSGTVTLAAFPATESRGYVLLCSWPGETQAALTWTAPTTFTDGTALPKCASATDTGACLAGYIINFGTSASALTSSRAHMFPNSTSTPVTGLTPGTNYFFAIRAVTGQGAQSDLSNTVSKTTAASVQVSQSAGVKKPTAPTLN